MYPWHKIDPDERYVYEEDYSNVLAPGDNIAISNWFTTYPLDLDNEDFDGQRTQVTISPAEGYTLGEVYRVHNNATSVNGDEVSRSMFVKVVEL